MKKLPVILLHTLFVFLSSFQTAISQTSFKPEKEEFFKLNNKTPGYRKSKKKNNAMFQGNKKTENYFEGWYFKMVSNDHSAIISIIPGISLSENGEKQHAFIQVINGKTATTEYFTFPIDQFSFSKNRFAVRIGSNYFSEDSIAINIVDDSTSITGNIQMSNQVKLWRKKSTKKNVERKTMRIMGWYRHAPFMQCYHGVVSLNHDLMGVITVNGTTFNFNKGIGYIEKDWGKSMPSSWVWIQSNSFTTKKTSFMLSIADVPWVGSSFPGFLGFFLNDSTITRFGTYSNAALKMETHSADSVSIKIEDKEYIYDIKVKRDKAGILKAPVKGSMDRRIAESIDAELKLTVTNKEGTIIFTDSSSVAGLEIVGNIDDLQKRISK